MKTLNRTATSSLTTLCKLTLAGFILLWLGAIMDLIRPLPMNVFPDLEFKVFQSKIILMGWVHFLTVQFTVYLLFIVILWFCSQMIASWYNWDKRYTQRFAVFLWLVACLFCFFANQIVFPWSRFSLLPTAPPFLIFYQCLLLCFTIILLSVWVLSCIRAILLIQQKLQSKRLWPSSQYTQGFIAVALVILTVGMVQTVFSAKKHHALPTPNKPNIIIIGIDSLSPNDMRLNGSGENLTPNISQFIKHSVYFTQAYSPLSRTFTAWYSLLTGNYPMHNSVRHNLTRPSQPSIDTSLPKILQQRGYNTLFATDGVRFNPIVKEYGFNQVISPPAGFNNFIVASFNDFPLTNLLVNTSFGEILFPYTYANREAAAVYRPQSFLNRLQQSLPTQSKQPIFLAIHLTLPHWPFFWANAPMIKDVLTQQRFPLLFKEDVKAADQQFAQLITVLKQKGLLQKALIIVLSDHGQSIGKPDERLTQSSHYRPGAKPLTKDQFKVLTQLTYGHGTDILNLHQSHIILSMQTIGIQPSFPSHKVNQLANLIDIKPTILAFLNQPAHSDGWNLLPWVRQENTPSKPRSLYFETGFTLPSLYAARPDLSKILEQSIAYFQLDPKTGMLFMKPDLSQLIIKGKQLAILSKPWFLAYYPIQDHQPVYILVNLNTGLWTADLNSKLGQQANAVQLKRQLDEFFKIPRS